MVSRVVGRYTLYDELASGGMATVYLARVRGEVGFSRVVAVKMLHAQYAREESFRAMFLDEARLVSRIRHPNVVATLDVAQDGDELLLVMEYIHGETLARLLRRSNALDENVPLAIVSAIVGDVLDGLDAAHEATSETGEPLHIVHRDVSPQNVIVASDGVSHVADFGVAKAVGRLAEKYSNQAAKGKAGYMPPEQMRGRGDRRADVYAAGVVLWETLVAQRLFTGESFLEIVTKALDATIEPPSSKRPEISPELDAVVMRALSRDPKDRFATARDMVVALERACPRAGARVVGDWVKRVAKDALDARRAQLERIESARAGDIVSTARVTPPDPTVETVSGLAPSRSVSPARSVAPWFAVGAIALAGTITFVQLRARHTQPAIATPTATTSVSAAPSSSTPTTFETTLAQTTTTVAPSATQHVSAPATHVVRTQPTHPAPSSSTCHWVELPNAEGILIPKKVCP